MKRSMTALAIFGLLVAPATVLAQHTWDGDNSSDWKTSANWDQFNYPGQGISGKNHTALINDTTNNPVNLPSNEMIGELTMQKGTDATRVRLDVDSGITLTITDSGTQFGDFIVGEAPGANGNLSYVEKQDAGAIDVKGAFILQAPDDNSSTFVVTGGEVSTS